MFSTEVKKVAIDERRLLERELSSFDNLKMLEQGFAILEIDYELARNEAKKGQWSTSMKWKGPNLRLTAYIIGAYAAIVGKAQVREKRSEAERTMSEKRAQVLDVFKAASPCRTSITEVYQTSSVAPLANGWGCETVHGVNQFVAAINTDANGVITVTSKDIPGVTGNITLTPTETRLRKCIRLLIWATKFSNGCARGPFHQNTDHLYAAARYRQSMRLDALIRYD